MGACVFCLSTAALHDDQILLRGRTLYLCAPRGQLVEGFFAVAPYACLGALSRLPPESFDELEHAMTAVGSFYTGAYGCRSWLVYEQGRGGGGASFDPDAGFPFHAHLCALPLDVDLHTTLADRFTAVEVASLQDLPATVGEAPYLYIDGRDGGGRRRRAVYLPATPAMRAELERSRLKPMIAELTGLPERGTWRAYAGDAELASLIARFGQWRRSACFRDDDGRDPLGQRGDRA